VFAKNRDPKDYPQKAKVISFEKTQTRGFIAEELLADRRGFSHRSSGASPRQPRRVVCLFVSFAEKRREARAGHTQRKNRTTPTG